jgi:16S rRNA (adenine1518-N6/adenine1519-N6)-dimethyltransferase
MKEELFRPTYLKELCLRYGLAPSKAYGQNYLVSESPIKKIIEAGGLDQHDTIVEIGPGFGVLTLAMAPLVKKIVSFEIEKTLEKYWEDQTKEFKNIEIVWGNVLTQANLQKDKIKAPYKLLANIPYQITSQILRLFLEEIDEKPERIILMVQKEVAERICAKPGDMSMLAISVQYYGAPKIVAKVTKGNFWPSPKVDSAILMIQPHLQKGVPHSVIPSGVEESHVISDKQFFDLVRVGFSHPRKQLWSNLSGVYKDIDFKNILAEITGNEKIRAEDLSVAQWKSLAARAIFSGE